MPEQRLARDCADAFNQGSDARIEGMPSHRNPYAIMADLGRSWAMGWRNVDKLWGSVRIRGFTPRELRPIIRSSTMSHQTGEANEQQ